MRNPGQDTFLELLLPFHRGFSRIAVFRGQTKPYVPRGRVVKAGSSNSYYRQLECWEIEIDPISCEVRDGFTVVAVVLQTLAVNVLYVPCLLGRCPHPATQTCPLIFVLLIKNVSVQRHPLLPKINRGFPFALRLFYLRLLSR